MVSDTEDRHPADVISLHLDYLSAPPAHPVFRDAQAAAGRLRNSAPALSAAFSMLLAIRASETCEGGVQWRWDPLLRTRSGVDFDAKWFRSLLGRISAPTVLVRGSSSGFVSASKAREQLEAIAGSREVILDGGHNLPVEAPAPLARLIGALAAGETLRRTAASGFSLA
jgi:pimeloyl-ACP methyl ester carboxylesterase